MHYAAFLRAINVGKHNRVKMEDLRTLCGSIGFANVSTYLQTGNIAFESEDAEESAAVRLEAALIGIGLRNAAVIVRTRDGLLELVQSDPFANYDPLKFTQYVTLLRSPLPPGSDVLLAPGSLVLARPREVLTVFESGAAAQLTLTTILERKLKLQTTTRYWRVLVDFASTLPPRE